MKAINKSNGTIEVEGSYLEVACLLTALNDYVAKNPEAIDIDIVKDSIRVLQNPELENKN